MIRARPICTWHRVVLATAALATAALATACSASPPTAAKTKQVVAMLPLEPDKDPPAQAFDAIGSASTYLTDDIHEREPRRARFNKAAKLFATLADAVAGNPTISGSEERIRSNVKPATAVEAHPDHVRVVYEIQSVQFVAYVQRQAFATVATQPVTLLQDSGETFVDGCGVTVPAGRVLSAEPESLELRRVVIDEGWLNASGSLDAKFVGEIYTPQPSLASPAESNCELVTPITVKDPTGAIVAKLSGARPPCFVHEQGDTTSRVTTQRNGVTVVGDVPNHSVDVHDPKFFPRSSRRSGHARDRSHWNNTHLWRGDFLYPDNQQPKNGDEPLGRVTRHRLSVHLEQDTLKTHVSLGPWGRVNLRITDTTFKNAQVMQAHWTNRTQFANITTTGSVKDAAEALPNMRATTNSCFDRLGAAASTHHVTVDMRRVTADVDAHATSKVDDFLTACVIGTFLSGVPKLQGSVLEFDLVFTPHPAIDEATP